MFKPNKKFGLYLLSTLILTSCLSKDEGGQTGLEAPPPDPITLTATAFSTTQINLSWTAGGGTTTGYRISYQLGATAPDDCESGTTISEDMITGTAHSVTGLTDDTQYAFRLCAINGNPFPDASSGDTDDATTLEVPPNNPTGPTATVDSDSQITLSWTSGGGTTADYRISYQLGTSAPANCAAGTTIGEGSITGTSHPVTGLSAGRDYAFRICAINSNPTPDVSSGVTTSETAWWNTSWKRRRKITFANGARAENLDNFTVLVKLDDPTNVEYAQTQNSGQDLRFIDADSTTQIDYEIETWNEAGDSFVWVEVPRIDSSSNTDHVWMYYGNAGAGAAMNAANTWDGNFRAVWHFAEDPTANDAADATSYGHEADVVNDVAQVLAGSSFCGLAYSFDGTGDLLDVHDDGGGPTPWANMDFSTDATISGWFYLDSNFTNISANSMPLVEKYFDADDNMAINLVGTDYNRVEPSDGSLVFKLENTGGGRIYKWTTTTSWTASTWYHFSVVFDAADNQNTVIYINGADVTNGTDVSENSTTNDMQYGSNVNWGIAGDALDQVAGSVYLQGDMDEVRVSDTQRSANWVNAQYTSMIDSLNTYSAVQSVP